MSIGPILEVSSAASDIIILKKISLKNLDKLLGERNEAGAADGGCGCVCEHFKVPEVNRELKLGTVAGGRKNLGVALRCTG